MFKDAPQIIFTGLTKAIGQPRDLDVNVAAPEYFTRDFDIQIPQAETKELKQETKQPTPVKPVVVQVKEEVMAEEPATEVTEQPVIKPKEEAKVPAKTPATEQIKDRITEVLGDISEVHYTPIKSLNTFNFDWKIKARITKKHPKKAWKNAKTAGNLLNIELIDSYGT